MSMQEITAAVMELPPADQLELARRIVAGVAVDQAQAAEITQAVRGIEDVMTGKVRGLSEAEFRDISERLGLRFRADVDTALERIKSSPSSAGHDLNTGSQIVKEVRR